MGHKYILGDIWNNLRQVSELLLNNCPRLLDAVSGPSPDYEEGKKNMQEPNTSINRVQNAYLDNFFNNPTSKAKTDE